jgi:hypothetical protein
MTASNHLDQATHGSSRTNSANHLDQATHGSSRTNSGRYK